MELVLLPNAPTVFFVKIAENKFKVARMPVALQTVPKVLDLTSVGIGTTQSFTAKNLNSKVLVTLIITFRVQSYNLL